MKRAFLLTTLVVLLGGAPLSAAGVTGSYIEARTCDVWTGPCFANAEMNLGGKHAILGWKIDKGDFKGVSLDGLGVVAVVAASDTLGLKQTGASKAVLIVDERATSKQREALVAFARQQGGDLVGTVVAVQDARVDLTICNCAEGGCANLNAGPARIETRCLDAKHDKVCGNESAFYPPLAKNVKVLPAFAIEHAYTGKGVNETWNDAGRRGAYLGSFNVR
jgi:Protein of unknown function (DUF1326)